MMIWNAIVDNQAGVTVTVPDRRALFDDLEQHFMHNNGFAVATLNLDHVVKLSRDPEFHAAYAQHTHVTADGNPIVWLSRLSGQRSVSLVPGSEVIVPLCGIAAQNNISVALVGATQASLTTAAAALRADHPTLDVVLEYAPDMGFDPNGRAGDAAIAAIRESKARLVFLALGAPKQEKFAARALGALPETGFVSIGAGLDFLSGAQTRAPKWVRAIAAEWLWRLLESPRRLAARYGACLIILPQMTWRALAARRRTKA